jgi:hypothetical protein
MQLVRSTERWLDVIDCLLTQLQQSSISCIGDLQRKLA